MKNNISRRDFIRTTAGVAAGVASTGGLLIAPGCKKENMSFAIPMGVMNTLGASSYTATMQEYNYSQNQEWTSWVKDSGADIRDAVQRHEGSRVDNFAWDFELLADNTVNAWCMPGARIAFYEGIMPLCDNPDGVAMVMGHEVAHAVRNHGGQRMAQQLTVQLGITALSAALSRLANPDDTVQQIALAVFGVGGQVGGQLLLLHYSREHEYEADKLGMIYAARAGYDPREAPKFWERMMDRFGGGGSDFLSTHPSDENRIAELNKEMPEAVRIFENRIAAMEAAIPEVMKYYKT